MNFIIAAIAFGIFSALSLVGWLLWVTRPGRPR